MAIKRMELSAYNFSVMEFARPGESRARWILNPPYQRGDLWTLEQKRNLIKSLLQGIPIGSVYVNARSTTEEAYLAVVDGKQRITTLQEFVDSRFSVPAEWFASDERGVYVNLIIHDSRSGLDQVLFRDLTRLGQGLFTRCTVAVCEAHVPTIEQEAEIYLLVNFGGVEQTKNDRDRALGVAGQK